QKSSHHIILCFLPCSGRTSRDSRCQLIHGERLQQKSIECQLVVPRRLAPAHSQHHHLRSVQVAKLQCEFNPSDSRHLHVRQHHLGQLWLRRQMRQRGPS